MTKNNDGCSIIISGIILLIYSIVSAFDGQFIPLIVVLVIIAILWIWSSYEKSKNQRDFQKITQNEGPYYERSSSKFPLLILIITIGVISLVVYKHTNTNKISGTFLHDYKNYEETNQDVYTDTSIIMDTTVTHALPLNKYDLENKQKEYDEIYNKSLEELYSDLIYFMRLRQNYFSKITSDFEALNNNGLLIINNSSIRILDIRMKYLSGKELSDLEPKFNNLSEGNFVYIQCINGGCMYNIEDRNKEIGMFQPFETMGDCFQFIELCEKIREKVN